jgi:NAD+ synthetase
MRVLLGQIAPVIADLAGNLEQCRGALAAGHADGVDVVLLPELAICGYPPRDLLNRPGFVSACKRAVQTLAAETSTGGPILIFGAPAHTPEGLYNAAFVAADGEVVGSRHKTLLPTYDVFDETRYFRSADTNHPVEIRGLRLGITICEDLWNDPELFPSLRYTTDPLGSLTGCDAIMNLSASPFHADKANTRFALLQRKAAQANAPVLYVNQVGGNDELLFDGHSLAVHADGRLLGQGSRFETDRVLIDTTAETNERLVDLADAEEHAHALTMGVRDYATRCGFQEAVIGLSGGIDSAVVCAIAARALGPENVLGVTMPGPYSSEGSVRDAYALAANLGMDCITLPIADAYQAFRRIVDERFAGRAFDVTEENLQARSRGALLMAISNKERRLVLTTGNKSELAVGYCTLYGDMVGGLAVIADLYKTEVYTLARWLNRDDEVIPQATIDKPPSAELAPDQKDEDSLPPYPVLDEILSRYLEERADRAAIVARGHDPALVDRVIGMIRRAEYKRWQAAPGLRVSSKAFGSGRRIPLAKRWTEPK